MQAGHDFIDPSIFVRFLVQFYFTNLKEILLSDCQSKLMEYIFDEKVEPKRRCNYPPKYLVKGKCLYDGYCLESGVIYKATCTVSGNYYFVKTMNKLKKRINKHISDLGDIWKKRQEFCKKYAITRDKVARGNVSVASLTRSGVTTRLQTKTAVLSKLLAPTQQCPNFSNYWQAQ